MIPFSDLESLFILNSAIVSNKCELHLLYCESGTVLKNSFIWTPAVECERISGFCLQKGNIYQFTTPEIYCFAIIILFRIFWNVFIFGNFTKKETMFLKLISINIEVIYLLSHFHNIFLFCFNFYNIVFSTVMTFSFIWGNYLVITTYKWQTDILNI